MRNNHEKVLPFISGEFLLKRYILIRYLSDDVLTWWCTTDRKNYFIAYLFTNWKILLEWTRIVPMIMCLNRHQVRIYCGLGGSIPLDISSTPCPPPVQRNPQKKFTHSQEMSLFANRRYYFQNFSILITKMYSFINTICHFLNIFACGGLWLRATLAWKFSSSLGQAP